MRNDFVNLKIGHNRTGKTADAVHEAEVWKASHPDGSIVAFDPQNRFTGILDDKITEIEELYDFRQAIDTLFIFDDYRQLHYRDRLDDNLHYILNQREEYCNDMIFIAHSPSMILERVAFFVSHYDLYYTNATDKGFKDKIADAKILTKLKYVINSYVKRYGSGEYPDFPKIRYTARDQRIELINIDQRLL